jgi:aminoglycoside/choline kinase family phosphotransferase
MTPKDTRLEGLHQWLGQLGGFDTAQIASASVDASFRRYFRAPHVSGASRILMDAPPDKEDLAAYLKVSQLLEHCGVHVPHVYAQDTVQGYAVLEDLGATHMLTALGEGANAGHLYGDALDALAKLQLRGIASAETLPPYDREVLLREMQLLPDWYCERHLGLQLQVTDRLLMTKTFELLVTEALAQPQVFVHRDYHSRNLMMTTAKSPGVIDFQDALRGPVGYDLASILKDCYVAWPREQVTDWVEGFRTRLLQGGAPGPQLAGESPAQFLRWVDFAGLQRHLKVLGIFARLCWRDGKTGYLADLPRTLDYVRAVCRLYPELHMFSDWVEAKLVPGLAEANRRAVQVASS